MKMYPMFLPWVFYASSSDPFKLSASPGIVIPTMRDINQLTTVATDVPLSCMISDIYSQQIGPAENSNIATNSKRRTTLRIVHYYSIETPSIVRTIAMRELHQTMIVLRPALLRR